ncbi:lipase [Trichoderma pleuroticola]
MFRLATLTGLLLAVAQLAVAGGPSVTLRYSTVVGSSSNGIDSFRGIPFAQPPVGSLRLKPPQPITSSLGVVQATTTTPKACPQFSSQFIPSGLPPALLNIITNITNVVQNQDEDCLTLNVQRPSSASSGSKLPVVFFIYGGAFESGATQGVDSTNLITASIASGTPIIYVAANYRLGGFGFLAGKELLNDGSTNLGLLDQRLALQWVADNIEQFGGDPDKVTLWGFSAGSISVFDQTALFGGNHSYHGKPLFRAALMESGSILPAEPANSTKAQIIYDQVVDSAGCSTSKDTLACLRSLDFNTFLLATESVPISSSYNSIALSYLPRPDGTVLLDSPEILASRGQFAKVPLLLGDQEDEGTLFSVYQLNLTSTQDLEEYLGSLYFQQATASQVQDLVATYPDDPSAGSPFRTGPLNSLYPEYKRLAAILGDFIFTLQRRSLLETVDQIAPSVPTWSFIASYLYGTAFLGTFHTTSQIAAFGLIPGYASAVTQEFYISFFNTMNPNSNGSALLPVWPCWGSGKQVMQLGPTSSSLLNDSFRSASFDFIRSNSQVLHI